MVLAIEFDRYDVFNLVLPSYSKANIQTGDVNHGKIVFFIVFFK